jgi:hypothetical protein
MATEASVLAIPNIRRLFTVIILERKWGYVIQAAPENLIF